MFDRITFNPEIMGGRACIRGMRITAAHLVTLVAGGTSEKEILEDYPDLEKEDIQQALEYAVIQGIRRGLESMAESRGVPAREAYEKLRARHGIDPDA